MSTSFSKHVVPPTYSSDTRDGEVQEFVRKTFPIKAIQLTAKNVDKVAAFCDGEIAWVSQNQGKEVPVVVLQPNKKDAKPAEARVTDWVICIPRAGRDKQDVFAVYNKHAFVRAFEKKPTDEELADAVVNVKDWALQATERSLKVSYQAENIEPINVTQNKDVVGLEETILWDTAPEELNVNPAFEDYTVNALKPEPSIRFNPGDDETPKIVRDIFEGRVRLQDVLDKSVTVGEALMAAGHGENAHLDGVANSQLVLEDGTILPDGFVRDYDQHLAVYVSQVKVLQQQTSVDPIDRILSMDATLEAQQKTLQSMLRTVMGNRRELQVLVRTINNQQHNQFEG